MNREAIEHALGLKTSMQAAINSGKNANRKQLVASRPAMALSLLEMGEPTSAFNMIEKGCAFVLNSTTVQRTSPRARGPEIDGLIGIVFGRRTFRMHGIEPKAVAFVEAVFDSLFDESQ